MGAATSPRRLLDLFCGAGGASLGYARAGFEVVGVDVVAQPNYPFEFVQADALSIPPLFIRDNFDAVHASPPCKLFTRARVVKAGLLQLFEPNADHLPATRALLAEAGVPFVIENVPEAPLRWPYLTLCGTMFGLAAGGFELRRHRRFELGGWNRAGLKVPSCRHRLPALPVFGHSPPIEFYRRYGRGVDLPDRQAAMGVDWTNCNELAQAIPPAFTEFVGRALAAHLDRAAALV